MSKTDTERDERTIKAHVDRTGIVWIAEGADPPKSTGANSMQFLTDTRTRKLFRYRVLGTRLNSYLIHGLYSQSYREEIDAVEVASPLAVSRSKCRQHPTETLSAMRLWDRAPSCGGWTKVGKAESVAYALSVELNNRTEHSGEIVANLLCAHPVWRFLEDIPGIRPTHIAMTLALILDPRFFVDPVKPNRSSRLQTYLGLDPKIHRYLAGSTQEVAIDIRRQQHAELIATAWVQQLKMFEHEPDCTGSAFLYRTWSKAGCGWKGLLKGSQRLISYIKHLWLDSLYKDRAWKDPLFVPEYFFKEERELRWFRGLSETKSGTA